MNRKITFSCAVLMAFASLTALLIADTLVVSKSGYYLLRDGANGPELSQIESVVVLSDNPTPTPVPPVPPNPVSGRVKKLYDAALLAVGDPARNQTALELSVLYRESAKKVRDGTISGMQNFTAFVKAATDMVLDSSAKSQAWMPFKTALTDEIVKLAQEGANDEAYAKLLDDASVGCESSAPKDLRAIDIDRIIKIIQIILELLKLIPTADAPALQDAAPAAGGSVQQ